MTADTPRADHEFDRIADLHGLEQFLCAQCGLPRSAHPRPEPAKDTCSAAVPDRLGGMVVGVTVCGGQFKPDKCSDENYCVRCGATRPEPAELPAGTIDSEGGCQCKPMPEPATGDPLGKMAENLIHDINALPAQEQMAYGWTNAAERRIRAAFERLVRQIAEMAKTPSGNYQVGLKPVPYWDGEKLAASILARYGLTGKGSR